MGTSQSQKIRMRLRKNTIWKYRLVKKKEETLVLSEKNLSTKYRSVILKGFTPDTVLDTITEELFKNGLPSGYNTQEILHNDKTGSLTLPNLEPEQCLAIMDQMHAKMFLGRKIYVTSVVSMSPTKAAPADPSQAGSSPSKPPPHSPTKPLTDRPASSSSLPDNSQVEVPVLSPPPTTPTQVSSTQII